MGARLGAHPHRFKSGYPLRVMHGYSIPASDAPRFRPSVSRRLASANILADIEVVADARRPVADLRAALVLEYIIRVGKAEGRSCFFRRSGYAKGLPLRDACRRASASKDGFICAAQSLNELLSRSGAPCAGIDRMDRPPGASRQTCAKTDEDRRPAFTPLAFCSDIGWRVHPDHRGEEKRSTSSTQPAIFGAVSHQGRAFVALSVFYLTTAMAGLSEQNEEPPAMIQELVPPAMVERARVSPARRFRVAHLISAARPRCVAGHPFSEAMAAS